MVERFDGSRGHLVEGEGLVLRAGDEPQIEGDEDVVLEPADLVRVERRHEDAGGDRALGGVQIRP